jgi:hypothetical protein
MVLGTCIVRAADGRIEGLTPESVSISGHQDGYIVGFTVRQVFRHDSPSPQEVSYIVPNNSKICMYGTTFRVGGETVTAVVEEKKRAEEIFVEASEAGRAAVIGRNLGNGLVEFKPGNVPGGGPCEVEVKCGFTASSSGPSSTSFKFPLDTCTPSGSTRCVVAGLKGKFDFSLVNSDPRSVSKIESNVACGIYSDGRYQIVEKPSVPSIIVTTELVRPLASECVLGDSAMAVTCYVDRLGSKQVDNNEFVFVIDCSGLMSGERICQARDCLQIFIRSLPSNSVFEVVRFGSRFESLFGTSSPYNQANVQRALSLAADMQANLGGTGLYGPLAHVVGQSLAGVGLRQVFVLTDGEIGDTDRVLELAASSRSTTRIFTIGIGGGADAGLV